MIKKSRKRVSMRRPRTSWYNKKYSVGDIAAKAYRGVKYIKSLINVEKKFLDSSGNGTCAAAGTIFNLTNLAQGDDYNNRDGNSILLQSLLLRANLSGTTADTAGDIIRIILFRDNDQRGTDPAAADLLENVGSGSAITLSPLNHNVNQRFSVLMDKRLTVGSLSTTATQAVSSASNSIYRLLKKWIKFPSGTHVKYTASASADASNYEGSLYLLIASRNAASTYDWHCRVRFTDN